MSRPDPPSSILQSVRFAELPRAIDYLETMYTSRNDCQWCWFSLNAIEKGQQIVKKLHGRWELCSRSGENRGNFLLVVPDSDARLYCPCLLQVKSLPSATNVDYYNLCKGVKSDFHSVTYQLIHGSQNKTRRAFSTPVTSQFFGLKLLIDACHSSCCDIRLIMAYSQ